MTTIFAKHKGKGTPVILLHGFPMNHTVWNDFTEALSKEYAVYTPDLPGFGKSEILPIPFSIDTVAEALLSWMEENTIRNSVLVGHSLGGYIALAMVEKRPELFSGLCLFHSTALADNSEKKESRTKALKFIDDNGVQAFTSNFIQPLFANPKHEGIEKVKAMSMEASAEAVKGYTIAMRDRPDRTSVLKKFTSPVLFIAGENDPGIPVESITQQAELSQNLKMILLKNTGHMGMLESYDESLAAIQSFLLQIQSFSS